MFLCKNLAGIGELMNQQKPIILASASPRRKEMLSQAGIPFQVLVSNIPEVRKENESPINYVKRNAVEKAIACITLLKSSAEHIILAADTIVVSASGQVLEKPADDREATAMLKSLSGTHHTVFTGYALVSSAAHSTLLCDSCESRVHFRDLGDAEITSYIQTREPFDKAGGYGIQGFGSVFIKSIEGSYTNVVGLPLCETVLALQKFAGLRLFSNT